MSNKIHTCSKEWPFILSFRKRLASSLESTLNVLRESRLLDIEGV